MDTNTPPVLAADSFGPGSSSSRADWPTRPRRRTVRLARVLGPFVAGLDWLTRPVTQDVFNPAYPHSDERVLEILEDLSSRAGGLSMRPPPPPPRPLVIITGYRAPRMQGALLRDHLQRLTGLTDSRVLVHSYWPEGRPERIVHDLARHVAEAFGSDSSGRSTEVDVVGVSMGGVLARLASLAPNQVISGESPRRPILRVRHLYTLASPHRGARLADRVALDPAACALRTDSLVLARLNAQPRPPGQEWTCYAILNDRWVGARNTAPPGEQPIWVPGPRVGAHMSVSFNPRVLADLARRLTGQPALGRPGAPPSD